VLEHRMLLESSGRLERLRHRQALEWMNELVRLGLEQSFYHDEAVSARLPHLRDQVHSGRMSPFAASRELLTTFHEGKRMHATKEES
jgi:putative protein kinase ArgK-like GTPase of G3E family